MTPTQRSFDASAIRAFAEGRPWDCFGEQYELARTHTRTPTIQTGDMLFLDRVTDFDPVSGGPWKRGYLRAEADVSPDDWFFAGHFNLSVIDSKPVKGGHQVLDRADHPFADDESRLAHLILANIVNSRTDP